MTQAQTETSISNGRRRARSMRELLGDSFFDPTTPVETGQLKETRHYVWMGLSKGDSFYTLRGENKQELEEHANALLKRLDIQWTVKLSIPSDAYGNVPVGVGEHKLVSEGSGRTGKNSFLKLRNSFLEHGVIERDDWDDEGYMPKSYRVSGYHS